MPYYRIAGAAALLFSAFFASYLLNSRMTKCARRLEGFINLLRFARAQIECYSLPVSEIFLRCDAKILADCGVPENSRPKSFVELLSQTGISDGVSRSAVESFADGFGKSYREEQLKGLDNTLNILVERKKILDAEFPKKKRVNTTLCISAALALIILML